MVRGAVGDRREWVRKGGEGKGASVNNPFKIKVSENLFTLRSSGRDFGGRAASRVNLDSPRERLFSGEAGRKLSVAINSLILPKSGARGLPL